MNKTENKLVPELRFPEFVNDGEWEVKNLGQLGIFLGGGTPDRSNSNYWIGNIPWISSSDISENNIHNISITRFINENAIKQSATKIVPKGSILFVSRVGVGKLAINKDDICTSQDFTSFVPHGVFNYFVGYYFSVNKQLLQSLNQGTSIKGFSKNDLENFTLKYPKNPNEQQKIADCLSSLDEAITAHNEKVETLKNHKKGLLQNLFPQEGETVPKYRFPEFKNDGEWAKKKLGDKEISSFVNQKISVEKLNRNSYISTENMLPEFSGISTSSKLPSSGSFTKFIEKDILFSNIRPYLKKVWKSNMKGGASNDILVFRSGAEIQSEFLECILKNDTFINYVMKSAKGVKMPRGDKDSMRKYPFFVPSLIEQQKIAACLSEVDNLITAQSDKIEKLKAHKNGLMQRLFPKSEN